MIIGRVYLSRLILVLPFLLFIHSCSFTLKHYYGVKPYKQIEDEKIVRLGTRHHFEGYQMLGFSNKRAMDRYFENLRLAGYPDSFHEVVLIDENGKMIVGSDSIISCNVSLVDLYLQNVEGSFEVGELSFEDLFGDDLEELISHKQFSCSFDKPLVIFTWASFTGRINKKVTKEIEGILEKDFDKLNIALLSLDKRTSWQDSLISN